MKKPEIHTGNKYSTNGAAQSGYLHLEECNTYHLYKAQFQIDQKFQHKTLYAEPDRKESGG